MAEYNFNDASYFYTFLYLVTLHRISLPGGLFFLVVLEQNILLIIFYGRRHTVEDSPVSVWLPGDYIPTVDCSSDNSHVLLAEMQKSISSEFKKVNESISSLLGRLDKIEKDVDQLKDGVACQTSTSHALDTPSSSKTKRKKMTHTALSVCDILCTSYIVLT